MAGSEKQSLSLSRLSRSMTKPNASAQSISSSFRLRPPKNQGTSIHSKIGVASSTEAYFVLVLGLLLSLNSGYINGLCLSGMLSENGSRRQAVSAFTGTYTKSGLALAGGNVPLFGFEVCLILCFIGGACISGALNPKATPHKLVPAYGPTFLIGSVCMILSAVFAEIYPEGMTLYYFAAVANGLQNGMTSTYSANLIRTSHLTGTSTDIGLIAGRMLRGNWKDYWKFKVLVGLAVSFWFGGLFSFYSASHFVAHSLWFSAILYLAIGITHVTFVTLTQRVTFVQATVGNWGWDKALNRITQSVDGGRSFQNMSKEFVDKVFDELDTDGSGTIDSDELKSALETLGMKVTTQNVDAMIAVVDDNGDGVIDRNEFHALVNLAKVRAESKQEAKQRRSDFMRSITVKKTLRSDSSLSGKGAGISIKEGTLEETEEDLSGVASAAEDNVGMRQRLPRTYQEALPSSDDSESSDSRAIIVTETTHPFSIVGVNGAWEDLCGYKSSEAISKSMSELIQGPKTNRDGLKKAMGELLGGAEQVECTTVNYRKDGSTFTNSLTMGPLYDDDGGWDEEEGKSEASYFVGILVNLGELAQDVGSMSQGA